MRAGKALDFFRKIPADLTESTALGAFFSVCAIIFMLILFFVELFAFMDTTYETSVILDSSLDTKLRINFNITMMDIQCDFIAVDVLDDLGTNRMNVTKDIEKWHLDENGVRKMWQGKTIYKEREEIVYETEEQHPYNLEELHRNGEHAIPLTQENFLPALEATTFSFVDFYAPWCIWCQRLAPTWELFAEDVEAKKDTMVTVFKVDCVEQRDLCNEHGIQSFPTLRFFDKSKPVFPDYMGDRTQAALLEFIRMMARRFGTHQNIPEAHRKVISERLSKPEHHPGCMINGHLDVNRVPGNFHVEARAKYHDLDPKNTNLSHIVHHLSFGDPLELHESRTLSRIAKEMTQMSPLDDKVFVNDAKHQAFHHYIKVVGTKYSIEAQNIKGYQMLARSQVMQYEEEMIPEARFNYQISPMGVVVKRSGRKWYDFITSVCAIVGGTFTVIGVIDAAFHKLFKKGTHY